MAHPSLAAVKLAAAAPVKEIAAALSVSERTVLAWRSGEKLPSESNAAQLAARFGIQSADWHRHDAPARAAGTPQPVVPPPRSPSDAPAAGMASDVEAAQAFVRALQTELGGPTAAQLDLTARVRMSEQLSGALARLVKLSGPLAVTPKQLLESSVWREIEDALVAALEPFPDALRSVATALVTRYTR